MPASPRASEAYEITTLSDFMLLQARPTGVIVTTDRESNARAHRTTCPYVNQEKFKTKVIEGERKRGSYYFFVRFADAERELEARWCKVCGDRAPKVREALPKVATFERVSAGSAMTVEPQREPAFSE